MPEYAQKRFGGQRVSLILSLSSFTLYLLTYIPTNLYSGALFITEMNELSDESKRVAQYGIILGLLGAAYFYTIMGGLTVIIWTDFLQTIFILIGGLYITTKSFEKKNGYENLIEDFFATENHCGNVSIDAMKLLPSKDTWMGDLLGITVSSIWYWCCNQTIIQRVLGAKNITYAKSGMLFLKFSIILPVYS